MGNLLINSPAFGMGRPEYPNLRIHRQNKPGFDLKSYMTSINLEKNIDQPAGIWEISLAYSPDQVIDKNFPGREETGETIEDLLASLETFDYVEIEVRSDPGGPTYWMRGFVDNISMSESAGAGGSIERSVTLNGRDYGGLLQDWGINFFQASGPYSAAFKDRLTAVWEAIFNRPYSDVFGGKKGDQIVGSKKKLTQNKKGLFNNMNNPLDVASLVNLIVKYAINDGHIRQIKHWCQAIQPIAIDVSVPKLFGVNPNAGYFTQFTGNLDTFLRTMQSSPWGEMFIRDEDSGPVFHFRVSPWLDQNGNIAWYIPGANFDDIKFAQIDRTDVISSSISKSINEVYTSFTTIPSDLNIADLTTTTLANSLLFWKGKKNPYNFADGSYDEKRVAQRYGLKQYEGKTPWLIGNPTAKKFQVAVSAGQGDTTQQSIAADLNLWLVHTMGHANKLYSGTLTCRGVYDVRIGDYIYYQRRPGVAGVYFYVQGVAVDWNEGSAVRTTFSLVRGQQTNNIAPKYISVPWPKDAKIPVQSSHNKVPPRTVQRDQAADNIALRIPLRGPII